MRVKKFSEDHLALSNYSFHWGVARIRRSADITKSVIKFSKEHAFFCRPSTSSSNAYTLHGAISNTACLQDAPCDLTIPLKLKLGIVML